ncbi:MAG: TrkH family potassium uptake protein [Proteobacteria bacterium]|nr:TrkH family potassium uptake protein [Pseudomonadota bacterium]
MQFRLLFHTLSILTIFLGVSMLLPLCVGFIYGENDVKAFSISLLLCLLFGAILYVITRNPKKEISHKEGFAIVTLGWITVAFWGGFPYLLSGSLHSFTDAYFESVSGFTTTGSTVITNIESMSHAILIWRSFTQWLGGMGIILLSIAILPLLGVGGMQLYKAEVPGPVKDKLRPRIGETAKLLWKVYLLLTFIEFILLRVGGMSFYDAICHSFTTMATGGFSTKNISIEAFHSNYIEGVVTVFMLLAGINFALHYQALVGNIKSMIKDNEFKFYIAAIAFAIVMIFINLLSVSGYSIGDAFRYSAFQAVSIMTTTGYSSTNFENWSGFGQCFLLVLMFIGGCAGSTAGGIKVLRVVILLKLGYRELYRLIHPRAVAHIKFNNAKVPSDVVDSIWGFVFLYMLFFVIAAAIMSFLGMDLISAVSSVAASIGNIGPGLGTVGPYDNFSAIPVIGKWVLIFCMILGRLEVYTLLILFIPEFWRK